MGGLPRRGCLCAVVCTTAAALALAGNAFARTPQLLVSGATATGASATTTVEVKGTNEDAAASKISIYVPNGYRANLGQSPGTQIGSVTARAQLLEPSSAAALVVSGVVLVADRNEPAVQADATRCTGTAAHAAIWLLRLLVAGTSIDLPVYADPAAGAESAFSSATLSLCLPNPYQQAAQGTRSPSGTKIFDVKLTLSAGLLTNPSPAAGYVWRTVITPWVVNGATANLAGAMEAQGIVAIPSSLSLKGKVKTTRHKRRGRITVTNSVLLSGKLLENLKGIGGARVAFFANGRSAGSATTGPAGAFAKTAALGKTTTFTATATVPTRETACVSPLSLTSAPAGCVSATMSGYKIAGTDVTVTPRKR